MAESLTNKTVMGVAWNSIDRAANYGIAFFVSIVLARLLSPEEYGLIGLINIFIAIFNIILDGGLSTALIRKERVDETDFNTVFYSNLILSAFLTLILYICAPLISSFLGRMELIPLLRAMSLVLVINALSLVHLSILTRNINFKDQTKISVIANVASGSVGIVMAFMGFGVWALVAQQLSSRLFSTFLYWFYCRWKPRLIFSWKSFGELYGFGWKLLVSRVINTVWGQLYQLIIGKFYSPRTLGFYTRSSQYVTMFSSGVSDVVLKVSLPAMSTIQNDRERLVGTTRQIMRTTMFVSFVFMMCMAAAAKPLIFVLIGEKWLPCVPMMQILCFNFVLNPVTYINENLLTVKGRSDVILVLQIIKTVMAIVPMLLGIFVGIYWMLIGSVVFHYVNIYIIAYYTNKYFGYSVKNQHEDLLPSFGYSLLVALPVFLFNYLPFSDYLILPLQIIFAGVLVITLGNLLNVKEYSYIKNILVNFLASKRAK